MNGEKDKNYLVDTEVDTTLTDEEKAALKKARSEGAEQGQQDVFTDMDDFGEGKGN